MPTLPALILSREAERLGSARELRRQHARGLLTRVFPGIYLPTGEWNALDADGRYRLRVRAAALRSSPDAQFSHDSAAALYRLPTVGAWPDAVHETVIPSGGGTSRSGILRHGLGLDPSPRRVDGVTLTSLPRTLVDIGRSTTFVRAVAMADHAMRPAKEGEPGWDLGLPVVSRGAMLAVIDGLGDQRGLEAARRVAEFADGRSGSPLESVGRVQFHALGLPTPELQVGFSDGSGFIGFADFYWRELDLIVEVDGRSKYGSGRHFQQGMTPDEILWIEKRREDRLRRVVRSFARLDAAILYDRRGLADRLGAYGLVTA